MLGYFFFYNLVTLLVSWATKAPAALGSYYYIPSVQVFVVVAQLMEWSLLTREVPGSNPAAL